LYRAGATITQLAKLNARREDQRSPRVTDDATQKFLEGYKKECIEPMTQYVPPWVKLATALALGFGTMIGWKRIVVTVGEKIGKSHLTYAQGASAELMAMATIFAADQLKMPVSTTHVLSSGVAGAMAANKSGLQGSTVRNLLLAWVLTLPVCTLLGAGLFAAGLLVILHNLVLVTVGVLTVAAIIAGAFILWRHRATHMRRVAPPVATVV
jgi:PiT family inorganic phosphate transporter